MKKRVFVSFVKASESPRSHEKDKTPPQFKSLANLYPSMDDGIPSLRSDFTYDTEQLEAFGDAWVGSPTESQDDFLNAIVRLRSSTNMYYSRLVPYTTTGGTATLKIDTYTDGTISGTIATSAITGSGTSFLQNAWSGCFLLAGSNMYLIDDVTSDTAMTIDGTLAAGLSGSAYTIYQTWHPANAVFPLSIQEWGNYTMVHAVNPIPPVDKDKICGPFINNTAVFGDYDWTKMSYSLYEHNAYDGTVFVAWWVNTLYYTSDPSTGWTSGQGSVGSINSIVKWGSKWVAAGYADIWESSDATATSWTDRSANDPGSIFALISDGTNIVGLDISGAIYYSTDLSGAWTTVSAATTGLPSFVNTSVFNVLCYTGTKVIFVPPKWGTKIYSTEDVTGAWTEESVTFRAGVTNDWFISVATDGTNHVAVGTRDIYHSASDSWRRISTPLASPACVFHTGTYFLIGDSAGQIAYSADGQSWTALETTDFSSPINSIYGNSGATTIWVGTDYASWKGTSATPTEDPIPSIYSPISTDYRAQCYAAIDAYIMLGGVKEWDEDNSIWKYYPNRFRWPSPGTTNDWDGEGAGFLDKPRGGAILDMRGVGHNILVFEEGRVALLQQLGDLDNPWGYRPIEDVTLISNPIEDNGGVTFVSEGGQLLRMNGTQVEELGSFDATEFDDWNSGDAKIWLDSFDEYKCYTVFQERAAGLTHKVFLVSSSGAITHIELPEWTAANGTTTMVPKSCFVSKVPGSERLYVGYNPDSNNLDHTVSLYLNIGAAIKGTDYIKSGLDSHWHAIIETGELRLVPEGLTTTMHEIELRTHSAGGTVDPDVAIQVKSSEESSWRSAGDTTGTASITSTTVTGTSTVFSNIIGSDSGTVFTTPQPAARCRVFKHNTVSDAWTTLALTTDYTITAASQITLVAALTANIDLVVYWDSKPDVKLETDDFFLGSTSDEMYRVTAIANYKSATVDHAADATEVVTHLPAGQMDTDDGYRVVATPAKVDGANIKIRIVPRDDASASTRAKVYGMVVNHQPIDSQERKNS